VAQDERSADRVAVACPVSQAADMPAPLGWSALCRVEIWRGTSLRRELLGQRLQLLRAHVRRTIVEEGSDMAAELAKLRKRRSCDCACCHVGSDRRQARVNIGGAVETPWQNGHAGRLIGWLGNG
jgi:hypothetical protein